MKMKCMARINAKYITVLFLLALFMVLVIPSTTLAVTNPTIKYFGGSNWEVFNGMDNAHDGGYVVVGHSSSNNGDLEGLNKKSSDALIVKFSAQAEVQWVKTFGGSLIDSFQNVKQTKDGGYIAVGSSSSIDMDMESSRKKTREEGQELSNADAIIVKFNSLGEVEWFQDFGGSGRDVFNAVIESNGDFIVVGESDSKDGDLADLAQGYSDAIYARYSHSGSFLGAHSFGGSLSDGFNDVVLLSDGSFVAVGYSSSRDMQMLETGDCLLKGIMVKIGNNLSVEWVTSVDLTNLDYDLLVHSAGNGFQDVKVTSDQGFIVVGKGAYIDRKADGSGNLNEDGRIYKFDSTGQEEWHDIYINQAYTRFFGVAQDRNGSYTVVGDSYMPQAKKIIALRYDAHGVRLWEKEDEGSRNRYLLNLLAKEDYFIAIGSKYIQGRSDEGLLYLGNFEESQGKLIMEPNTLPSNTGESTPQIEAEVSERLGGNDRYETAVAISKNGWEKSEHVILANGNNFSDALVGSSLAYLKDAPILITPSERLDNRTKAEIERLEAKTITILGNYTAVAKGIEDQLKQKYQVIRINGPEVLDTAVKVGEEVRKVKPFNTVIIATQDNFPDALAIAPYSAKEGIPILFSRKDSLRADTKKALQDWKIENVIIAGGPGVISSEVDLELDGMGLSITRLGGYDRYDTALEIASHFGTGNKYIAISIATGENYPDALTGAVLAAKNNAPLILVNSNGAKNTVVEYLNELKLKAAYIFGGTAVVGEKVVGK